MSDIPPDIIHDVDQFHAYARDVLAHIVESIRTHESLGVQDDSLSFVNTYGFVLERTMNDGVGPTAMVCAAALHELARLAPRAKPMAHNRNEE